MGGDSLSDRDLANQNPPLLAIPLLAPDLARFLQLLEVRFKLRDAYAQPAREMCGVQIGVAEFFEDAGLDISHIASSNHRNEATRRKTSSNPHADSQDSAALTARSWAARDSAHP